jgi:hypothetical protein
VLEDGTVIELTLIVDMLIRMNSFDESHHPIDNEHDKGGSRAITYTDPSQVSMSQCSIPLCQRLRDQLSVDPPCASKPRHSPRLAELHQRELSG